MPTTFPIAVLEKIGFNQCQLKVSFNKVLDSILKWHICILEYRDGGWITTFMYAERLRLLASEFYDVKWKDDNDS